MIPFFRKIRKKMADDNKPLKYMRYAIGEIILVVIGILIALQINTWNEERKLRILEIKTLKELRSDLHQSLVDIDDDRSDFKRLKISNEIILNHVRNKLPYSDSLKIHFLNLEVFATFSINRNTFDNLNNMDNGLISNDSLRASISNFYTKYINLYKELEQRDLQEHLTSYVKPMIMSQFKTYDMKSIEIRDYQAFVSNLDNVQIISFTIRMLNKLINYQTLLIEKINELDMKIGKEIKG